MQGSVGVLSVRRHQVAFKPAATIGSVARRWGILPSIKLGTQKRFWRCVPYRANAVHYLHFEISCTGLFRIVETHSYTTLTRTFLGSVRLHYQAEYYLMLDGCATPFVWMHERAVGMEQHFLLVFCPFECLPSTLA